MYRASQPARRPKREARTSPDVINVHFPLLFFPNIPMALLANLKHAWRADLACGSISGDQRSGGYQVLTADRYCIHPCACSGIYQVDISTCPCKHLGSCSGRPSAVLIYWLVHLASNLRFRGHRWPPLSPCPTKRLRS